MQQSSLEEKEEGCLLMEDLKLVGNEFAGKISHVVGVKELFYEEIKLH